MLPLQLLLGVRVTLVPERPLLAPWYRLVGDGDRLLLEYGQSVVALEGAAVRTFLPVLLPLLDGTRGYDDLVARLGTAVSPALDHALETLAAHGLLVDGPDASPGARSAAHAVASAFDLPPSVVEERLASAVVGIVGSSPLGAEIARLLRLCGIEGIRRVRRRRRARASIAVVAPGAAELEEFRAWNHLALERGTRWLPVRAYDGRFATVGPLIIPGESCCFECVLLRRAANVEYREYLDEVEEAPLAATADAAVAAFVAALAAHLVLRSVAGRDTTLPGILYAVEVRPALALGEHPVLRVPRCPACSGVNRAAPRLPWHEAEAA